jgi:hypothetical protein
VLAADHQGKPDVITRAVDPTPPKAFVQKLKDFIKKCKSANYCKVMKGLLDKIQENCNFIEERRKPIQFSLKDKKSVVSVDAGFGLAELGVTAFSDKGRVDRRE